jgi:hypothetical protein
MKNRANNYASTLNALPLMTFRNGASYERESHNIKPAFLVV